MPGATSYDAQRALTKGAGTTAGGIAQIRIERNRLFVRPKDEEIEPCPISPPARFRDS